MFSVLFMYCVLLEHAHIMNLGKIEDTYVAIGMDTTLMQMYNVFLFEW